jgi:hypothetical protein
MFAFTSLLRFKPCARREARLRAAGFLGAWVALAGGLFLAGCATAGPAPVPPVATARAQLVVVNLTDYEWSLVITRPAGGESVSPRLRPRATVMIDLLGGDYLIDQSVLPAGVAPELSRRIPTRLEAGKTYRWRLGTLLSESAETRDAP